MQISEHIDALRREGELLADAATATPLDTPVPTCPGWTLRDLVGHTAMVHRWAATYVRESRPGRLEDGERAELSRMPDGDAALLETFREGHAALVDALRAAPDDLDCWHFLAAPSAKAFWARRQAHETAIHRADAQSPGGSIGDVPAEFAVDGVDELLNGFMGRRLKRMAAPRPMSLALRAEDTGDGWTVHLDAESVRVDEARRDAESVRVDEAGGADCTATGPASRLYLLLWNRVPAQSLSVDGDPSVLAYWRESAQVRWG